MIEVVNNIAPLKTARIKNTSNEWFDQEIAEKLSITDKLFKKFKSSCLNIDWEIYKEARSEVQRTIKQKKKQYLEEKLSENIARPKERWQTLKSLGLPNKKNSPSNICLKNKNGLLFDSLSIAEVFKSSYSSLAENLVLKLPKPPSNFWIQSVNNSYKKGNFNESLLFSKIESDKGFKILKNFDESKAPGIVDLSGIFLKDSASLLATPITQLWNLSVSFGRFPYACKIAKLKPLFKKGSKTDPKNYRPISFLPLIAKVLERIVHEQSMEFLDKHNILYKFQSEFWKNHSTDFCLSYLTDKYPKVLILVFLLEWF